MVGPEGDQLLARALVDLYSRLAMSPQGAAAVRAGVGSAYEGG
ncbi:hypothetical protein [Saccharopolyspora sp. NPDC050642]